MNFTNINAAHITHVEMRSLMKFSIALLLLIFSATASSSWASAGGVGNTDPALNPVKEICGQLSESNPCHDLQGCPTFSITAQGGEYNGRKIEITPYNDQAQQQLENLADQRITSCVLGVIDATKSAPSPMTVVSAYKKRGD